MTDTLYKPAQDLADSVTASVTAPSYGLAPGHGPYTITNTITNIGAIGSSHSNIPNVTISSGTGLNYASPWATTAAPYLGNGISADATKVGTLKLQGEGADIEVNGVSLMDMLKRIEERLNILAPNAKMEAEWDQLRELGEQYRALEKKLQEQGNMWAKLKAMPLPDIG